LFKLINGSSRFLSDLLEANPNQNSASDMVTLNTRQTTLTAFNTSGLFGLSMKLLNLPTQATHVLGRLGRILSKIVGSDKVRALGGKHQPEQFHLMTFGKVLDVQRFSMLNFVFNPRQAIHPLITAFAARLVHLAIGLQGTVVDFIQAFNVQQQFAFGLPTIHQHPTKRQVLVRQRVV